MADMPRRRRRVDRRQTRSAGAAPWSGRLVALLGLIGLLTLVLGTLALVVPLVEEDLEALLLSDLQAAGVDTSGLVVDFDYRNATIVGIADRPQESLAAITAEMAGRGGIRAVDVATTRGHKVLQLAVPEVGAAELESEPVEPEVRSAVQHPRIDVAVEQGTLTLRGTVSPNEEAALLEAAGATGRTVYNELAVSGTLSRQQDLSPLHDAIRNLPDDQSGSLEFGADGLLARLTRLVALQTQLVLDALDAVNAIEFDTASSELLPPAAAELRALSVILLANPDVKVIATGHADSRGSSPFNQTLSEARAAAVTEQLVGFGVDRHRLTAVGRGESDPIGDNGTASGQQQNRRVALTVAGGN